MSNDEVLTLEDAEDGDGERGVGAFVLAACVGAAVVIAFLVLGASLGWVEFVRASDHQYRFTESVQQAAPDTYSFVDEPSDKAPDYDTVTRVGTQAFVLWLNDTKTCRVQIVLPTRKAGGVSEDVSRKRLIFPSVDKEICGR